ncbi:hypothetical protein [Collimonas sp. OK607]|nr:hypothetical protein [Collimonas sp. OK607]
MYFLFVGDVQTRSMACLIGGSGVGSVNSVGLAEMAGLCVF